MISVVVVDESKMIRKRIKRLLESDRRIVVAGLAGDGDEALEKAASLNPDVMTLDMELFRNNGRSIIEQLRQVLRIPVIFIGSMSRQEAELDLKTSLDEHSDFITKPFMSNRQDVDNFRRDLIIKIRSAALRRRKKPLKSGSVTIYREPVAETGNMNAFKRHFINPAIALGISTGGPRKLLEILPMIPADFPAPIFLTQHMPAGFTSSLANRLDSICGINVKEARNGERVRRSVCYIAPGDQHLTAVTTSLSKGVVIRLSRFPEDVIYRPSVDIMMESVAKVYGSDTVGIIMTGMGSDGTRGMREIRKSGGLTIAEDSSTCTVYGMPRSVIESGLADIIVPDSQVTEILVSLLKI